MLGKDSEGKTFGTPAAALAASLVSHGGVKSGARGTVAGGGPLPDRLRLRLGIAATAVAARGCAGCAMP